MMPLTEEFADALLLPNLPTRVYCWGNGPGGVLGLNKDGSIRDMETKPVELNCSPSVDFPVDSVFAGETVSTLLSESGSLYSWGSNLNIIGRRAPRAKDRHCTKKISKLKFAILKVAYGKNHVCALARDGEVWAWGDASKGKLGIGGASQSRQIHIPRQIPFFRGKKCIDIACGDYHTAILTSDRQIHMFGSNDAGQLGIGNQEKKKVHYSSLPKMVKCSVGIIAVSSGTNHNAAISIEGHMFTWGWGENGRLGHGDENKRVKPERIESLLEYNHKVNKIACGSAHTCALTEDGILFSFGWNVYGQIGTCCKQTNKSQDHENVIFPKEVIFGKGEAATTISCGFGHSAAITESGKLYTWGFNGEGQLGHGHEKNMSTPTEVDFNGQDDSKYVLSISCGHTHSLCVTSNYTMYQKSNRQIQNESIKKSKRVLVSFSRYILMKIRLRWYRVQMEKNKKNENIRANINKACDQNLCGHIETISDHEISSEYTDSTIEEVSYGDFQTVTSENEDIAKCMQTIYPNSEELQFITYEDERSSKVIMYEKLLSDAKEKARLSELEEARQRLEMEQIKFEDDLARLIAGLELVKKKNVQERKAKQFAEKIDARTRRTIEKESQRILEARAKRNNQSKSKLRLPKIRRQRYALNCCDGNLSRPRIDAKRAGGRENEEIIIRDSPNQISTTKKNAELIRNRKMRLSKAKKVKNENLTKHEFAQETIKKQKEDKMLKREIDEEKKRLHYLLLKRKLEKATELVHLQSELIDDNQKRAPNNLEQLDEEGPNACFKSVTQWQRELSTKFKCDGNAKFVTID